MVAASIMCMSMHSRTVSISYLHWF